MLEDQRDQAIEKFNQLSAKVQESAIYINISERYENLSPNAQKGAWIGLAALALFFLLSIPLGFVASSSNSIQDMDSNRNLIADLIRVKSLSASTPAVPRGLSSAALKADIQRTLDSEKILEEQIISITPVADTPKFIPKSSKSAVVEAKLKDLNLRQVVGLGHLLGGTKPTTKLLDFSITPDTKNDHYFNVTYKLVSFGPPDRPRPAPPKPKIKSKRGRKNRRKSKR